MMIDDLCGCTTQYIGIVTIHSGNPTTMIIIGMTSDFVWFPSTIGDLNIKRKWGYIG